MRFLFQLVGVVVVALAVGFGLSYYALTDGRFVGALRVGPWTAWPGIGSSSPDPYNRAYLARTGTLELGQSEGLAFTAATDSSGRTLDRACRYRIGGNTPVASFWTLQALAPDGSNIAASAELPALQSRLVARADDGSLLLYVSRSLAPDNWLEITGSGPFQLALTLYDSASISGSGVSAGSMPSIVREACA